MMVVVQKYVKMRLWKKAQLIVQTYTTIQKSIGLVFHEFYISLLYSPRHVFDKIQ